jgi:coenzyme Q-binding protein COQ10
MGHVRDTFHIDAPPDRAWGLYTDPSRYSEWQAGLGEVKDISGPLDQVGSKFTAVVRVMGRRLEATSEVTKVEPGKLIEQHGSVVGGGPAVSTFRIEPVSGGTDMTVELDYELPGGLVGDIADKLFMERAIERQIRHSNENFKALAEARVGVSA